MNNEMDDEGKQYYGEAQAAWVYAKYRPKYSQVVFDKIMDYHNEAKHNAHRLAVDVCCGPGNATVPLTKYFGKVIGVDVSSDQLRHVPNNCPNLETRIATAEDLSIFGPNEVDMVTIAMGLHYVDEDRFFTEVKRILKPGGTFAAFSYLWDRLDNEDAESYMKEIRAHFPKYIGARLQGLFNKHKYTRFPFTGIKRYDEIKMPVVMTVEEYTGWLSSIHFTKLYDSEHEEEEPIVEQVRKRFKAIFGEQQGVKLRTTFPVYMILGRKEG